MAFHFERMGCPNPQGIRTHVGSLDANSFGKVQSLVRAARPRLIIVDTLEKGLGVRDINDYSQASPAMQPWIELARECQSHVMFVHHQGKGDLGDGRSILGSTAIEGAVDTVMILSLSEKKRFLEIIKQRCAVAEQMERSALEYNAEDGTFELGLSERRLKDEEIDEEVFAVVAASDEPLDSQTIRESLPDRPKAEVDRSLRRQRDTGRLSACGKGRKGSPYLYSPGVGADSTATPTIDFSPSGSSTQGEKGKSWDGDNQPPI